MYTSLELNSSNLMTARHEAMELEVTMGLERTTVKMQTTHETTAAGIYGTGVSGVILQYFFKKETNGGDPVGASCQQFHQIFKLFRSLTRSLSLRSRQSD